MIAATRAAAGRYLSWRLAAYGPLDPRRGVWPAPALPGLGRTGTHGRGRITTDLPSEHGETSHGDRRERQLPLARHASAEPGRPGCTIRAGRTCPAWLSTAPGPATGHGPQAARLVGRGGHQPGHADDDRRIGRETYPRRHPGAAAIGRAAMVAASAAAGAAGDPGPVGSGHHRRLRGDRRPGGRRPRRTATGPPAAGRGVHCHRGVYRAPADRVHRQSGLRGVRQDGGARP